MPSGATATAVAVYTATLVCTLGTPQGHTLSLRWSILLVVKAKYFITDTIAWTPILSKGDQL